jgi:hypothetical protein
MGGEGFYKKTDKAYIQKNQRDGQGVGEEVLLRLVSGRTAGDPTAGVQPTLTYTVKKTRAVVRQLTPEEIVGSSGIYQYGDLDVELLEELKFADERTGDIGDRVVYQSATYRVVGKPLPQTIEGRSMFFKYVMRKVGDK